MLAVDRCVRADPNFQIAYFFVWNGKIKTFNPRKTNPISILEMVEKTHACGLPHVSCIVVL